MTPSRRLTRRRLIAASLLGLLALPASAGAAPGQVPVRRLSLAIDNVLASVAAPARTGRAGSRYLAQTGRPPSLVELAEWFAARDPALARRPLTGAAARQALVRMHLADLRAHRVARIDGWVVSETEARRAALCALALAA